MNVPIRDIKPNVEIIDIKFYFFLGFLGILVIALLIGLFFYLKYLKKKKEAILKLEGLLLKDSKFIAYHFKEYAKDFIEKEKELFLEIENELQKYKYKKNTPALDEELKLKIKEFIRKVS